MAAPERFAAAQRVALFTAFASASTPSTRPRAATVDLGRRRRTVNEMFLYSTVSTLKPIVGIVVTTSPNLSL